MRNIQVLIVAAFLSVFNAQAETFDEKHERFARAIESHPFAERSYWLQKQTGPSEWTSVALFYGYVDNFAACDEFANLRMKVMPPEGVKLRCVPFK